jgi:hypothetical protein
VARWADVEKQAPELAAVVRERFTASKHHIMATIRKDGSPRASGTEVEFSDGELTIGSMPDAMKARDLLRDPRIAIHSGPVDPSEAANELIDVKIAGRAIVLPAEGHHAFRIDVTEVVSVRLGDPADHLVIDSWHEGRGTTSVKRS